MRLRFGSGPWMTSFQTWGHEWLGTGLPYSRLIFRLVQLERLFYVCLNSWLNVDWWNTVKNWMDWNGLKIYLSILNWLYMCRYFQCGKVKLTVIKKKTKHIIYLFIVDCTCMLVPSILFPIVHPSELVNGRLLKQVRRGEEGGWKMPFSTNVIGIWIFLPL